MKHLKRQEHDHSHEAAPKEINSCDYDSQAENDKANLNERDKLPELKFDEKIAESS